jgi:transposase
LTFTPKDVSIITRRWWYLKTTNGSKRDFAAMEKRRMKAARMFEKGKSQAEVARTLGASRQSASVWYHRWKDEGKNGLKGAGRAGRKPKVTPEQLARVKRELLKGPRAHGYKTELWTLPRIARAIEKVTGVRYHPGHVWRIVRSMGWSCQKPTKVAAERNEEEVADWLANTWPKVKKTPAGSAPRSSS